MTDNLLVQSFSWLLRWNQLSILLLLMLIAASAIGVSFAAYHTRQQYTKLQEIRYLSDDLDSDYEKLLLEQSAQAGFFRIYLVAKNELNMKAPQPGRMVIVDNAYHQ